MEKLSFQTDNEKDCKIHLNGMIMNFQPVQV